MHKIKETLYLTLKKPQFKVTSSGEKTFEYRKPSKWILSRLIDKSYNNIKFTNGYGKDKPNFLCEFKGWGYATKGTFEYSNGLTVKVTDGDVVIKLGKIIEKNNFNSELAIK